MVVTIKGGERMSGGFGGGKKANTGGKTKTGEKKKSCEVIRREGNLRPFRGGTT